MDMIDRMTDVGTWTDTRTGIGVLSKIAQRGYNAHMDGVNEQRHTLLHGDITHEILAGAFEVAGELGTGFVESVYEHSLALALAQRGLEVKSQRPLAVRFRGQIVGEFFAGLVVGDCVIVELKAVKALAPEHEAQLINYLKATGKEVGLLINFGHPKLEYHRYTRKPDRYGPVPHGTSAGVS
ncbi:MAG: GxxExxY protein [Anaerolineae bacterium]